MKYVQRSVTQVCLYMALVVVNATSAHVGFANPLDGQIRQLIVGIAPDWNSSKGSLILFERGSDDEWHSVPEGRWDVLFGKNGLAWGRGISGFGDQEEGRCKTERDGRAPAGCFRIGRIYTYDSELPFGADFPFHQVTLADAWSDDPSLPNYNEFVTIPDVQHPPAGFAKAKMRHGDFAYRWLIEIRHNSDPPHPGVGSAIFFHIRRGVTRPTSGCTSMAEANLVQLIQWLRAEDRPVYLLLPREEYLKKQADWKLPNL